jgi:antitoxin PrlF
MAEEEKKDNICEPSQCCKVEAVVSVDERGQMVLPKELRDKVGIHPGDKLAVVSMQQGGQTCCISLIKAETFSDMVKDMMGPMMAEVFKK